MVDSSRADVAFDLADKLEIHDLDVTPHEAEEAIEFEVHATITDASGEQIEAVQGSRLRPEQVVCSIVDGGYCDADESVP